MWKISHGRSRSFAHRYCYSHGHCLNLPFYKAKQNRTEPPKFGGSVLFIHEKVFKRETGKFAVFGSCANCHAAAVGNGPCSPPRAVLRAHNGNGWRAVQGRKRGSVSRKRCHTRSKSDGEDCFPPKFPRSHIRKPLIPWKQQSRIKEPLFLKKQPLQLLSAVEQIQRLQHSVGCQVGRQVQRL